MLEPILFLLVVAAAEAPPDTGNLHPMLDAYAGAHPAALSFLSKDYGDIDAWRSEGRAKMQDLLAYSPAPAAEEAEVLESRAMGGYTRHTVRYSVTSDRKTEAYLLIPDGLSGPAPAVLALHCHSGFYYSGKEKIAATENTPEALRRMIEETYDGRPFADELARRGFVVLVPDAFYFGSQRLDPAQLPPHFTRNLRENPTESGYIRSYNLVAGAHEELTAKTIFTSGTTWPGILFQGDRASVDYLLTRPEVDPERLGCMGLSIGGFRSAHLFGLDPRLKAAVVAGWMTTYRSLLPRHLRSHTWMIYVPGQQVWLDLPDVVTLNAPRPLMVINCLQDNLFPLEGMHAAESHIAAVYEKMGAPEGFRCNYYDVPHSLGIQAQDDAIGFLEKALK